ncbi:MAG: 30S ribosomal protein S9 [Lentisphaerales bacterium]|nr:30S ribosomal protein S9 [Lentisphaerales bacterium]
MADKKGIWGTGRRKTATARVKLVKGSGQIKINGKALEEYFPVSSMQSLVNQPLQVTGLEGQLDLNINVRGGGLSGQSGAVRHGISRALCEYDADLRAVLKQSGMLTRDARKKERNKPGQPGARKRFQFSKR